MTLSFSVLRELLQNEKIQITNYGLNKIIKEYDLFDKSEILAKNIQEQINKNIKQSKFLIINCFQENNQKEYFFIISFSKTIIFIHQSTIIDLKIFFSNNYKLPVYFLPNTESIFSQYLSIPNPKALCQKEFLDEIYAFTEKCSIKQNANLSNSKLWKSIISCISGYLIKESYSRLIEKQSILDNFFIEKNCSYAGIWNKDDYIELRNHGTGSLFRIVLIYHINNRELFVIKKPIQYDPENEQLIIRELNNYSNLDYIHIPKLYGKTNGDNYPIIQFIHGQTLEKVENFKFSINDKISIILQIILTISYLHGIGFVYRDLKPDNIIVTENKTVFIVDFDRMIKNSINNTFDQEHTANFSLLWSAPEVNNGIISEKNDIYSIGQIIYYIINERYPSNNDKIKEINQSIDFNQIYKKCIATDIQQRPSISELIINFFWYIFSQKRDKIIENDPQLHVILGKIYFDGKYVARDINEAIQYFTFAATQNNSEAKKYINLISDDIKIYEKGINKQIYFFSQLASQNNNLGQCELGKMYYNNEYVKRDINKAIYYLTLSANQNYSDALYSLGHIYYIGKFVARDINKAIYYLSLAANQNHLEALYNLGHIYYIGEFVMRDINKAIHYFALAANQNNPQSQFALGLIYSSNLYIKRDINRAIYYYTLAANQNNIQALFNLGIIFFRDDFLMKDIDKAIYYLTQAANQNLIEAHLNLGLIYSNDEYNKLDINKSIYYYTQAANMNNAVAQYLLGCIYYYGEHIKRDISKSIYYFSQAANNGDQFAQHILGMIYLKGHDTKEDINKSIYYFTLAANQNNLDAQYSLGIIYSSNRYDIKNIYKAIFYFTQAANQNDTKSQFSLGLLYYDNKYIQDIAKSIHYLTFAANKNLPEAQNILGTLYIENKDIQKGIYYLTLAAKNNLAEAQFNLASIYYAGNYIARDINRAIYYFEQASNHNIKEAQFNLGTIFLIDRKDIKNAIHYLSLASNNNFPQAQYNLGMIYIYEKHNIKKAMHYLHLASNQNFSDAQYALGKLYLTGKYITRNCNLSIHYLTLAAKNNSSIAQFFLGYFYSFGFIVKVNVIKGINYFIQSADNNFKDAYFPVGYFYHEGQYITRDINKALHYYKEASSFNNQYAQNNLGIIYKNGIDEIPQKIGMAMTYFTENIQSFNDKLSMFNLSHIYIYDNVTEKNLNIAIDLLIKSSVHFNPSYNLLCIALIKKLNFNLEKIQKELNQKAGENCKQALIVSDMIKHQQLFNEKNFKNFYQHHKMIDYAYDYKNNAICSIVLKKHKKSRPIITSNKNITSEFYEGLGKI